MARMAPSPCLKFKDGEHNTGMRSSTGHEPSVVVCGSVMELGLHWVNKLPQLSGDDQCCCTVSGNAKREDGLPGNVGNKRETWDTERRQGSLESLSIWMKLHIYTLCGVEVGDIFIRLFSHSLAFLIGKWGLWKWSLAKVLCRSKVNHFQDFS
jgi:hypothetical protein